MYVCVTGIKEPSDAEKFFHCNEQREFAQSKFFKSNGKVFFEANSIDELIDAQAALEGYGCLSKLLNFNMVKTKYVERYQKSRQP